VAVCGGSRTIDSLAVALSGWDWVAWWRTLLKALAQLDDEFPRLYPKPLDDRQDQGLVENELGDR
jgi:hypothetical protein